MCGQNFKTHCKGLFEDKSLKASNWGFDVFPCGHLCVWPRWDEVRIWPYYLSQDKEPLRKRCNQRVSGSAWLPPQPPQWHRCFPNVLHPQKPFLLLIARLVNNLWIPSCQIKTEGMKRGRSLGGFEEDWRTMVRWWKDRRRQASVAEPTPGANEGV